MRVEERVVCYGREGGREGVCDVMEQVVCFVVVVGKYSVLGTCILCSLLCLCSYVGTNVCTDVGTNVCTDVGTNVGYKCGYRCGYKCWVEMWVQMCV